MAAINGPFETARLCLRRALPADRAEIVAMNGDTGVMRFIGSEGKALPPGSVVSEDTADRLMTFGYRQDGFGLWMLEWRHQPEFLGWVALFEFADSADYEVGYRLVKSAWGQGIATEAAGFMIDHGFKTMNLAKICAVTHQNHSASQKVLEKIGLSRSGNREYRGVNAAYFEIHRDL